MVNKNRLAGRVKRHHRIIQFMFYSLVGLIGTLAHYSILYALVEFHGLNPVWASGCGALAGLIINYALNYLLTFKSQQCHAKTFPKFALTALVGLGINLALMAWLTQALHYLLAQLITTAVVLLWGFLVNTLWTFQHECP